MVTDNDGFLWIATDNGLKRYDGYTTRVFINNTTSSGSSNVIKKIIYQDEQLWAASVNLNKYVPETQSFESYNVSDRHVIWTLFKQYKTIWIGGEGFGLRGFNIDTMEQTHQAFNIGEERFIKDIKQDKNSQKLWVASASGLYLYDPSNNQSELWLSSQDIGDNNQTIECFVIDKNNAIWIATRQGLFKLNIANKKLTQYFADKNNPNTPLTNAHLSLFKDNKGDIWLGTDKYGVSVYNHETDSFMNIPSELTEVNKQVFPPVAIFDIHQDKHGSYWFATADGVRRLSLHLAKFNWLKNIPSNANSLSFDNVLSLHQDKDGLIWIATDGGGLDSYNPKTEQFEHFQHNPDDATSLSSDSIIAINEDDSGNLWFGTYNGGFNKFDKNTKKFTQFKYETKNSQGLLKNDIFKIFIDKQQRVWLSVWERGLQIFDPKTSGYKSYIASGDNKVGESANYSILDIEEANNGNYWIAGYAGLEKFNLEKNHFTSIYIKGVDTVFDILPIDQHSIWLCTDNGLFYYNDETKKSIHYSKNDGLVSDFVVSVERDSNGFLWLGTDSGLNRFNPTTGEFKIFTKAEGLVSNEFNRFSHLYSSDGLMYFGGPRGINVFDPTNMPGNNNRPSVIFNQFEIRKSDGSKINALNFLHNSKPITLEYNENDILFQFAALDFIAPQKNKYKYILSGLENTWNEVDANGRKVRYTNLSEGHYRFIVKASNNEGIWNEEEAVIDIIITPALWHRWWAYVSYALLITIALYVLVLWRIRANKLRATELAKQVEQRTLQLYEANQELEQAVLNLNATQKQLVEAEKMASLGDLVAGIAHEVNTPLGICLTSISHIKEQIDQLLLAYDQKRLKEADFKKFKSHVITGVDLSLSNIIRASELIRSFKQVAVDQSSENIHQFDVRKTIEDTVKTVTPKFKRKQVKVLIHGDEQLNITSYPGILSQVIINFIMNSITHGLTQTELPEISIEFYQKNEQLILIYRDNGKGIQLENKNTIFEPFYTTNRSQGNTGLGMHIVYNLVNQKLLGNIVLNSPEIGVEFVITIPITLKLD